MTYALVSDIPVSWATYEDIAAGAFSDFAEGLIIHVAGPTDEGVRVIDVWESEGAYRAFVSMRLQPLFDPGEGPAPTARFRDLDVRHVAIQLEASAARRPGGEHRPRAHADYRSPVTPVNSKKEQT